MRFDGKKPIEFSDETVELEQDNLEEETKYKLKLDAPSEPASSVSDDEESLDAFADAEGDDDLSFGDDSKGGDEKPFDDEPFDAGVETDEDEDPEKFIQQLAGKLGTSLRKYNDERGEPDFDLEKYAINSVISATHTAEMDEEDQKDIIKKVKMSGAGDENDDIDKDLDMDSEEPKDDEPKGEEPMGDDLGFGDDEEISEMIPGIHSVMGDKSKKKKRPSEKEKKLAKDTKSDYDNSKEDYENLIGKSMEKSEVDELFKKKLDSDTIELQGNEIDRIKKEFPGITDEEIADKLLNPQAKADGITADALLTREYDLGEDLDSQYKKVADIRSNMNLDSFYLIFAKHKRGVTLISKSEPTSRVDGFASGDDTLIPLFVDGDYARKIGANWSDYVGRQYNDPIFDEFKEFNTLSEEDVFTINLRNIKQDAEDMLAIPTDVRDEKLKGHKWADDHISTSADDAEEVADFLTNEGGNPCWDGYERVPGTKEGEKGSCRKKTNEALNEAEYKGRKVTLNKPTNGDKKKFKVYVKNDKGNVIKVEFGDPNMEIRRDNAKAKKSFRARHKCSEKKDKTTAGYWSCKMWSNKKVSDITEDLDNSEKNPIFVKNISMRDIILHDLHETTKPAPVREEPAVVPEREKSPSPRRRRIWETKPSVKPNPKMEENNDIK